MRTFPLLVIKLGRYAKIAPPFVLVYTSALLVKPLSKKQGRKNSKMPHGSARHFTFVFGLDFIYSVARYLIFACFFNILFKGFICRFAA